MPIFDSSKSLTGLGTNKLKRDNIWLLSRLDHIWTNYFADITQDNPIFINFGRYSKYRLGSIKYDRGTKNSYITITAMFKDPRVPVEVVDHTIAHELCHYTHGFSSPKKRTQKHPHSGGVIKKEMEARNCVHLYLAFKSWVKDYRKSLG